VNERSVTVVAGIGGSGKTTFTFRYLANAKLDYRFIFDPDGQYADAFGMPAALDVFDLTCSLCRGWVLFDPAQMFPGEYDLAFAHFCLWAANKSAQLPGRKLLVVEEAWKYVNRRSHPKEIETCVRTGRHHGLGTWWNTQTPGQLPEVIRSECSELVCFHLDEEKTLEWPSAKGLDTDEIKALPNLHFVARNIDSRGELRGAIKI
jgi:hypothetical protein